MSSPQKGWCFSSHPEISGKCISITRVIRINPPTPPLQLLRHVRHQESRTPEFPGPNRQNTDGNKNTEMLNRRPSVGFFRPALSSGKTHTKTWAKSRELWRNAGKCFVIFFATTNAHTNPNNYADEIPKKNMFVVFPPKYWSFNDLWYIWLVVEFPTKSSHRFSHLGWWQRLDQSSCFLHARPKGDDYKEFRPEFF